MLFVNTVSKYLDLRAHVVHEVFVSTRGIKLDVKAPFFCQSGEFKSKCDCYFWRICFELSFDVLAWPGFIWVCILLSAPPTPPPKKPKKLMPKVMRPIEGPSVPSIQKRETSSLWIGLSFVLLIFITKAFLMSWGLWELLNFEFEFQKF